MPVTNPFTRIKAAMRAYLGAHWDSLPADNPAKVKIGNRFRKERHAELNRVQSADLPEVDVRPVEGGEDKLIATSDSSFFTRLYEFGITTDDISEDESLDQAEWELIQCAKKMAAERLNLAGLVTKVVVNFTRQTREDAAQNRGRKRWTGTVILAVTFQYANTDFT